MTNIDVYMNDPGQLEGLIKTRFSDVARPGEVGGWIESREILREFIRLAIDPAKQELDFVGALEEAREIANAPAIQAMEQADYPSGPLRPDDSTTVFGDEPSPQIGEKKREPNPRKLS